jgi:hypothetical protein
MTASKTATDVFALLWVGWIAYFAIVEGAAFMLRRTDLTLSDFTWRFEGAGWTAARYLVAAGLLWAFCHLVWGMFR